MKVCMVAYTFYETDNRVRRYAETLAKRGDEVDAIVLRRDGQSSFAAINGVDVYRIQQRVRDERGPLTYLWKLSLFFVRCLWLLSVRHWKRRYDIIHVHSVPDFQVFAAIVPRFLGAKVILDIHDIIPEFYASKFNVDKKSYIFRVLLAVEKLSAAYASHVIIANHLWYAKLIDRSTTPEKCTTIMNYPDTSIFYRRPRKAIHNGDFVMCYPGTLNWHQGLDLAIRAVALAHERAPQLRLLIVGDGPERERLRELLKELHVEGQVTIAGSVPMEQVAEIMATVDLGLVPKRKDSFGNEAFSTKIMEFMAMGVPVLASATLIDQYYFDDRLVQFFASGDVADLADKMIELAFNSQRREALRTRSLDFIARNTWDVRKHEYLELADRLARRPDNVSAAPLGRRRSARPRQPGEAGL